MLIPEEIKKCVVFIGIRNQQTGAFISVGTGFFLAVILDKQQINRCYLVTAKHVIEGIQKTGQNIVWLRINLKSNKADWFQTKLSDWVHHHDSTVDVCVLPFPLSPLFDILSLPTEFSVTEERIKNQNIGPGDEVFITGLFSNHYGSTRNIPIVRVGTIAAMPEDKVNTKIGPVDAYLIEARSIGGLSGSPVFINLGLHRFIDGQIQQSMNPYGVLYLLGLIFGHFDDQESPVDTFGDDIHKNLKHINMGIAVVTPISKVLELLFRKDFVEEREMQYQLFLKGKAKILEAEQRGQNELPPK